MNTEKVYVVVKRTIEDIRKAKITNHLQNIVEMLENLLNNPDSSYQQSLASSLTDLLADIDSSKYDSFPPSFRQIIEEIDSRVILGNKLGERVKSVIERNQITFQIAIDEIRPTHKAIISFVENGDMLIKGMQALGFNPNDLESGMCEIGYLIPRKEINDDFHEYQEELQELELILNTFNEYVCGSKNKLELRSMSSSNPIIYIGIMVSVGAAIAKSVDWIINAYKKILEIRLIKAQLKDIGIPDEKTKGIEEYANELMQSEIKKLLIDLRSLYCEVKDHNRKNELENGLTICLNKIANRIDSGYSFEIRVGELPKAKDNESEEERKKMEKSFSDIREVESNISFMNLEGSKLLSLTETTIKK